MKICFSTLACPEWDLGQLLTRAGEFGYHGVDFYNLGRELDLPAQPAFSTEADRTREQADAAGVQIVTLSCDAALDARRQRQADAAMDKARRYVDAARAVGARFVRVLATDSTEAGDEQARLGRAGERLARLAEAAADADVSIVVENAGIFCKCERMWWLVDRVGNPRLGACWNPVAALDGVEKPSRSVPIMGSKIRYFKVKNVKVGADNVFRPVPLDEGEIDIKLTIELLKGIGYAGWLCFEWERLWNARLAEQSASLGPLADAEQALPAAAGLLLDWLGLATPEPAAKE